MQAVDFTTLMAVCAELQDWLPARIEQVYQIDRFTIALHLRTLKQWGWLTLSWHPQAARIGIGESPPRIPDTFTFSDQLRHQLNSYVLINLATVAPWERVIDLQFAKRPNDPPIWHLYVEIVGKYSNIILTDAEKQIVTVAHQVTSSQSSVRTVQTGQFYELPPTLLGTSPSIEESLSSWRDRVSLIPGTISRQLFQTYRGVSPMVARSMLQQAQINAQVSTDSLTDEDWQRLFKYWQEWLQVFKKHNFQPGWTVDGYTVLDWDIIQPEKNVQVLLNNYYTKQLNQQTFEQLKHQLNQKIKNILSKLRLKADNFEQRLQQSDNADNYRQQADLLMANLHLFKPGMSFITLEDFETGKPINISLNPEKNAVQNAQAFYKQHQKLKRARAAIEPLLKDSMTEIGYLEQVVGSLSQLESYQSAEDLQTLEEIKEELIQQKYIEDKQQRDRSIKNESKPYRYLTPSGFEIWIGRNNRQNDQLTFRSANDYDLWFHTQEIPGSHVLLRLEPGSVADESDLQIAADYAAYYSQARQSEQVPVVYTKPKYVYKPKGAKPGMVVYKQEKVLWGCPQRVLEYLKKITVL